MASLKFYHNQSLLPQNEYLTVGDSSRHSTSSSSQWLLSLYL